VSYEPRFSLTPALLARAEAIAALRERIQGAAVQVAWIPALQKDARIRNAHSSTAIEGNPLTLEEVRAVEEGAPLPTIADRARREVVNYFAALRHIEAQAGDKTERAVGRPIAGAQFSHHALPVRGDSPLC
jgi:cell filamentation protein, protein adenylyltransferase